MKHIFDKRKEFHKVFDLFKVSQLGLIPHKQYALQYDMLLEELDEYRQACEDKDLVEVVDALGDILYLTIGAAYTHGMTADMLEDVYNEIHRSNMSKLTTDGKVLRREDGKVMKSTEYFPPNIKDLIK